MRICLFEDDLTLNLLPLNYLRHTSEVTCGAKTLYEKLIHIIPEKIKTDLHSLYFRKQLVSENFRKVPVNDFKKDDYLLLNSRIIYTKQFVDELLSLNNKLTDSYLINNNTVTACFVSKSKIPLLAEELDKEESYLTAKLLDKAGFKKTDLKNLKLKSAKTVSEISYHFDTVNLLESELTKDLDILFKNKKAKPVKLKAELINQKDIYINKSAQVMPGAVIDAQAGKVYISENVKLEPFVYIKGPVYIGKNATVRAGSQLYGPLSIGESCKVSGEIINSVFMSYVNKQHYGFIGHSYMCSWVNLGAGTTTSNLKNNYSNIRVTWQGSELDTSSIFLGSIIGDFTKTGINTMLNTGSIIGISSNVFGSGYQDKFIRSFRWVLAGRKEQTVYAIHKALETAKISMERRDKKLSPALTDTMRYIFKNSEIFPI